MVSQTKNMRLTLVVAIVLGMSACSGGSSDGGDTQVPTATITFPPLVATTEGETITVHGTADDDGTIAFVRINGVEASTNDGFATWFATVPLATGPNPLIAEISDAAGNNNSQAARADIQRQARFANPSGTALDADNSRLLVVDNRSNAVITIDFDTGARVDFSG
jgi:sugar lactone lactonase YvrE